VRRDSSILKVFQVADDGRGWGREFFKVGKELKVRVNG
jgi:hypothetical protein